MIKNAECTQDLVDLVDLNNYDKNTVIRIYMSKTPETQTKKINRIIIITNKINKLYLIK